MRRHCGWQRELTLKQITSGDLRYAYAWVVVTSRKLFGSSHMGATRKANLQHIHAVISHVDFLMPVQQNFAVIPHCTF